MFCWDHVPSYCTYNCITVHEVKAAAEALKNGRATGPDKIPSELIKYSNNTVFERYANCLNTAFETSTAINSNGKGNITPFKSLKSLLDQSQTFDL